MNRKTFLGRCLESFKLKFFWFSEWFCLCNSNGLDNNNLMLMMLESTEKLMNWLGGIFQKDVLQKINFAFTSRHWNIRNTHNPTKLLLWIHTTNAQKGENFCFFNFPFLLFYSRYFNLLSLEIELIFRNFSSCFFLIFQIR